MVDKTVTRSAIWCLLVATTAFAAVPGSRLNVKVDSQRLTQLHEAPGVDGKPVVIITGGSPPGGVITLRPIVVTSAPFGVHKPPSENLNSLPSEVEELPSYIDIGAVESQPQHVLSSLSESDQKKVVTINKPDGSTNVDGHELPSYDVGCVSGESCTFIINTSTSKNLILKPEGSSYNSNKVKEYIDNYGDILANKNNRPNSYLIRKMQSKKKHHMSPMEAYKRDQIKLMKLRKNSESPVSYRRQQIKRTPSLSSRLAQLNNRYSTFQERLRGRLATSSNLNAGDNSRLSFYRERYSPYMAQPFSRYRQARRITSGNVRGDVERVSAEQVPRTTFRRHLSSAPLYVQGSESDAREVANDGRVRPFVSIVTDEGKRRVPNALYRA